MYYILSDEEYHKIADRSKYVQTNVMIALLRKLSAKFPNATLGNDTLHNEINRLINIVKGDDGTLCKETALVNAQEIMGEAFRKSNV